MNISRMTTAIVAIVVMVIVVVTVAVPIISSLDSATGENTGETARYDVGGSHTIAVGSDGVTIDGDAITNPSTTTYILIADTLNVSMSTAGALMLTTVSGTTYATTTIASGGSLSLANGTASYTATSGGAATTYDYSKAFIFNESGKYGAYSGATVKALGSTTVTAWVASSTQMGMADVKAGQLTDATAYTISGATATEQTITAVTSGYTENEDGSVSYTAPMTLTYSDGTISATTVLAPVSYGLAGQESVNSIITIIPVIMVVGILLAVVGAFLYYRR